jgi:TolB-like protein
MERGTNEKAPGASATVVKSRPSIAVLGFKNLSSRPDTGWLSTALSEMISTELAAGGQLRTVPAENVSRARLELSLKNDEAIPKETLSQLYKNVGADFLVDGSYLIARREPATSSRSASLKCQT